MREIKIKYKKIPKSRGRNFCDDLWSILVKHRDGNKCVICGVTEYINSHHLISRRILKTRFSIPNGISLCPSHHEYGLLCSAHTSWWNFDKWVKENRPEQYSIWLENRKIQTDGEEVDYDKLYKEMEEQYKTSFGSYFRIERIGSYLLFLNFEDIKNLLLKDPSISNNKKIELVIEKMKEFSIGNSTIKEFLKSNKLIQ